MKIPGGWLLAVIGLAVLIYFLLRNRKNGLASNEEEFFIAASPQSDARAQSLLPANGTEDRRDLLKAPAMPAAPASDGDYRPDPKVNWVVDVTFPQRTKKLEKAVLLGGFDEKWTRKTGGPELYGKGAEDGQWTFVGAGDSPDLYSELAFAWPLVNDSEQSPKPITATELAGYYKALNDRVSVLGDPDLKTSASPESAAETARALAELKASCDLPASITLKAPPNSPFEGRKIWDVMMSLGLKWGDMDLFHWVNDSDQGDDSFFRVWTSSPPGYFLPEEIVADRVHTTDLVFGFSIPRCAAPQSVFASMVKAAEYARQRLGGELLDSSGRPLDVSAMEKEISTIEQRLNAAGFTPGVGSTLYIF